MWPLFEETDVHKLCTSANMASVPLPVLNNYFPVVYPDVGAEICKFWSWVMQCTSFALWVGSAVHLHRWTISNVPLEYCLPIHHPHMFWFEALHFVIPQSLEFLRNWNLPKTKQSCGQRCWNYFCGYTLVANVFVPFVHFHLAFKTSKAKNRNPNSQVREINFRGFGTTVVFIVY